MHTYIHPKTLFEQGSGFRGSQLLYKTPPHNPKGILAKAPILQAGHCLLVLLIREERDGRRVLLGGSGDLVVVL